MSYMKDISKELLERLYLVENKSQRTIAKELGCGPTWIGKLIKKYNIHKDKSIIEKTRLDRIANTNIKRYGSVSPFGSTKVKEKSKSTLQERYQTHTPYQMHLDEKTKCIINSSSKMREYLKSFNYKPSLYELVEDLQMSHSAINNRIKEYHLEKLVNYYPVVSKSEKELRELIESYGIEVIHDRTILDGKEIDLYCPSLKLGIEFNGNYWHDLNHKPINYHQDKSLLAQLKGVFLYHIFEYEWLDPSVRSRICNQLKNILHKNKNRIYARKCVISNVDADTSNKFLNDNHVQGEDRAPVRLGLFYEGRLVSLMTFCIPRFNKKYEYELSRFCSLADCNVIGGASRLFTHFIKCMSPHSIISYSNIAHTKGDVYSILGFKLQSISKPNYKWVRGRECLSRYKTQKFKLVKQFPQYKDMTETQIMNLLGYEKIEDCGNKVWLWTK